jgi:hypothetical protein
MEVKLEPTQVKHISGGPLEGRLLALNTNNGLGWKGLSGQTTLLQAFINYENKKFYNIDTWSIGFSHWHCNKKG